MEDRMVANGLFLVLLQYSGIGALYPAWLPMTVILLGITAGIVAGTAGRSGVLWGAFVGVICAACAAVANQPYGIDLYAYLAALAGGSAVSGAVCGLLGGWIGKKIRTSRETKPWRCGKCGASVTGEYCECGFRRAT
jgi:hypothetical protein